MDAPTAEQRVAQPMQRPGGDAERRLDDDGGQPGYRDQPLGERDRVGLGIIFESSLWPGRAPAGHTLLRLIYGGQRDPEAVTLDDATLLAQAERDVALVLGEHAVPVRRGVTRWRDGIAGMPVGHAARLETVRRAAAPHRLVLAGAGYHGVAVNDLCADGRRVAADVARLT